MQTTGGMGAIINPLNTEAIIGGVKKDLPHTIYLPTILYSVTPLAGKKIAWGLCGRGEQNAIGDSLIGKCLELSGARTVNPSGNTPWLT